MKFFALLVTLLLSNIELVAQSAVVNSYFNTSDVRDEWTEIIVTEDNLDMRNWTLRDNNSSQTNWQPAITFNNIPFWSNMRAGTIIVVWHRIVNSSAAANPEDTDKSDGFIMVTAQNSAYFTGGSFGSSPGWSGNTLNIAANGEIIQLRDAAANHVHALGHLTTAGSEWISMPAPKLNHTGSIVSGMALYTCPGAVLSDFNGPATGGQTETSTVNLTFGLPNTCTSSPGGNTDFVRQLREPQITPQTITASTGPTSPILALTFTWNSATDPNPSDDTQGYMIVKNTAATFGTPVDGTTYAVGDAIPGGGEVIDNIDHPGTATVSYTDFAPDPSGVNCYRVFAYRYQTDDINGNSYHVGRGRAYNTTHFITVECASNPLPVELLYFEAEKNSTSVTINWATASEINNSHFEIERSADGFNFNTIALLSGGGNSTTLKQYNAVDSEPLRGLNYYRLKQVDHDGNHSLSDIKTVDFNHKDFKSSVNYTPDNVLINTDCKEAYEVNIYTSAGQLVYSQKHADRMVSLSRSNYKEGMYLIKITCSTAVLVHKVVISP